MFVFGRLLLSTFLQWSLNQVIVGYFHDLGVFAIVECMKVVFGLLIIVEIGGFRFEYLVLPVDFL